MRSRRKKYRLKRKWPFVFFFLLALCMMGGGFLYAMYWLYPQIPGLPELPGLVNNDLPAAPEGRINLLLLGTDARRGEKNARTDSIILASIDTASKQAAMLSIPRDTRVDIPGRGMERINTANVYGGPELTVQTVEDLLGVPIDYYVLTRFDGFKDIVDTLGGVTIDVEKNMYYSDPTDHPPLLINLKKGVQRMNGDKAMQYVRFRHDALGDISRTQRQQKFLKALAKEMLQTSTIVKLPELVPEIKRNVQTNLGLMDMLGLARAAKDLDNMNIVSETLPGRFMTINGASYWGVDPDQARTVVAKLFEGEKAPSVVQDSNPGSSVASQEYNDIYTVGESTGGLENYNPVQKNEDGKDKIDKYGNTSQIDNAPELDVTITPEGLDNKSNSRHQTGPQTPPVKDSAPGRPDKISGRENSGGETTAPAGDSPTAVPPADQNPADAAGGNSSEMPSWLSGGSVS